MHAANLAKAFPPNLQNSTGERTQAKVRYREFGADDTNRAFVWLLRVTKAHCRFCDTAPVRRLLVGAAVAMNARNYLKNIGMRFDLPLELWQNFSKPIVFYGLSYRVWPRQPYPHLDKLKRAMEYILENPRIMFSVRNDGTKTWLEGLLGYQSEKIEVIPDPALYVPVTDSWHPELMEGKVNILISLNNEDESYRFGTDQPGWEERKHQRLRQLALALERLSQDWDLNIVLCPHYFDDYKIMSEFISVFPSRLAHQKTISSGLSYVGRASYFYDLYAKADLAISMRIHSMSPAIGLGTPMVALSTQPRMTDFMRAAGLEDFLIDFFDANLADKLYGKISHVLHHRNQTSSKFENVRSAMRSDTLRFNQRVACMFAQNYP